QFGYDGEGRGPNANWGNITEFESPAGSVTTHHYGTGATFTHHPRISSQRRAEREPRGYAEILKRRLTETRVYANGLDGGEYNPTRHDDIDWREVDPRSTSSDERMGPELPVAGYRGSCRARRWKKTTLPDRTEQWDAHCVEGGNDQCGETLHGWYQ